MSSKSVKAKPRKRSRRLEEMLPSVRKRARASGGVAGEAKKSMAAAPTKVAAIEAPPKAFQLAASSVTRVHDDDPRFRLRNTNPPVEIFKHVGYTQRGATKRTLAPGSHHPIATSDNIHLVKRSARSGKGTKDDALPSIKTVLEEAAGWIERHCAIPTDFERPSRFGPLSGSTYCERVVQSFSLGLIKAKTEMYYQDALDELVDAGFSEEKSHLMLQPTEGNVSRAELLLSA